MTAKAIQALRRPLHPLPRLPVADYALYGAALCGLVAGMLGNRAAWALLASFVGCTLAAQAGLDFSFPFWMMVDTFVAVAIIRPKMSVADTMIIGLFIPAWGFYLASPEVRFWGCYAVVIGQFMIAFAAPETRKGWHRLYARIHGHHFEKMVAHG